MSLTKNHELSSWKVVLAQLRRTETTWRGKKLSRGDHATYTEAILLQALVVVDLSKRYEGFGTHSDHVNLAINLAKVDVGALATFVSESVMYWRQTSLPESDRTVQNYTGFKHLCTQNSPFAGLILGPIRGAIELHFVQQTPSSFYPVYQYLSFLSHLTLVDIDMSAELEERYIEQEEVLAAHHLPDAFVEQMNVVMRDWLRDFEVTRDEFVPKHGPGGVAELTRGKSVAAKYQALRSDALIDYVLKKHIGLEACDCFPRINPGVTSRTSRIVFVPKSMKTKRVISAEPATLQYMQQGVDRCLRKYMANHHYLKRRIDLRDQSVQRDRALEASSTRDSATVDLSSASDSVSYELVKRVFRGTALLPFLVALRSRSAVLPSGKVVEMAKFAPMGSALCFPVQTLIFACIAECTAHYMHYRTGQLYDRYRVYGDDIIIPDPCFQDLVVNLRWCGFSLNVSKTYAGSARFRESCGCDAYDGRDVTPLKISRRYSAERLSSRSPGVFVGLVALVNSCHGYEFPLLRRYLVDKLINGTSFVPYFSTDPRHGVQSPSPSNYRLPRRDNDEYQREEVLAAGTSSCQAISGPIVWSQKSCRFEDADPDSYDCDDIRYFEWLRRTFKRTGDHLDPDAIVTVCIGDAGDSLVKRWISDPPLGVSSAS